MQTTNSKCETTDKQPCGYAGNREVLLTQTLKAEPNYTKVTCNKCQETTTAQRTKKAQSNWISSSSGVFCDCTSCVCVVQWCSRAPGPSEELICIVLAGELRASCPSWELANWWNNSVKTVLQWHFFDAMKVMFPAVNRYLAVEVRSRKEARISD